jgi:predicted permease
MDRLRQDLAFALRLLGKDRAFAVSVVLTLAICLGANAAIFTVVRSVLLRPLPYPEPDRLVFQYDGFPGAGVERAGTSIPNYYDRLAFTDTYESQGLYQASGARVGTGPGAEGVASMNVTPSFFRVLRTRAARGRLFTEDEGQPGRNNVVVLAEDFAARQPGGLDGIVGRQLRVNDQPCTVVGVVPRDFLFLDPNIRLWTPLAFTPQDRGEDNRYSQNHQMIGRLAPGATVEQAQAKVDALNVRVLERAGPMRVILENAGYLTKVVPLQADLVRNVRASLQLLWGGVLFVLLIAAVNITNLALVRANGRLREIATRHALGAGRSRVVRQLVTEATLLTLAGAALGFALAWWGVHALVSEGFADLPRSSEIRVDAVVVLVMAAIAVLLGLVIGAVPALQIQNISLSSVLRDEGRAGTAGRHSRSIGRALVAAQVGLAFVLLVGAGLLLASFRQLLQVDPGFVAEHVLTGRLGLVDSRYPEDAAVRTLADRSLERIRALPGVAAAGLTTALPFSWDDSSTVIIPEGYAPKPGESVVSPRAIYASPGYLETLHVPLRRGRLFTAGDVETAPRVVIVDEALARRFWGGADPIGKRMYLPQSPEDVARPGPRAVWLNVVGVVGSVKMKGLVEGEEARAGAFYFPFAQSVQRNIAFAVRTTGDPSPVLQGIRQAIGQIDPEVQVYDVFSLPDRVERSLTPRKTPMLLSIGFGLIALLLASIGIYGVLAYQVGQRTREIGIRMALGCEPSGVLGLVFREGAVLVAVGLTVGAVGAVALQRVIASQLYGVRPLDPIVLLSVTGVLALTAGLASLWPARRAARVDPIVALSDR